MRILLVSHRFPPDGIAGIERITQTLAAELGKAGDTVSIVTRRPAPVPPVPQITRERLPDGTSMYRFVGGKVGGLDHFLAHHERLEQLFEVAMLETAPDVVHVLHLMDLSPRFIEIAYRQRAAVVLSLQDFYFACPLLFLRKTSGELCAGPDGGQECARTCFAGEGAAATLRWGLRTTYFRRLLSMAERLICPSQYVLSYFEQLGADPARLRMVPNGVSIEAADSAAEMRSTPKERGTLTLAFLGSVVAHKGVHVILEALRVADLGSVDLVVFGPVADPQYASNLRERAAAIPGLKLRLYGGYEPAELPLLLHDIDCVITPSLWPEAFAIVTREALTRGIPLIATRLGALPEAVVEGENGFTFDPDRPDELAGILRRIAGDESLLRRLRAGARATPVLTVSEHTNAVRTIYQEAVTGLAHNGAVHPGDVEEVRFLHSALLDAGFGIAK